MDGQKVWIHRNFKIHLMYDNVKILWKTQYIRYTKLSKFNQKLTTLDRQIIWIRGKIWKVNGNLCTVDVQNVRIRGKIWIYWIYNIVKIQWKIVYTSRTGSPDSRKNSNSWNVQYSKNSMGNCVHWMDKKSEVIEKYKFSESTVSWKFNE